MQPLLCFLLLPSLPQDLQSRELPTTRIQPDRRWFGNTRVIGQKQLEQFRDEMATKINDSYTGTATVPWTVWHGFPAVFKPSLCVCTVYPLCHTQRLDFDFPLSLGCCMVGCTLFVCTRQLGVGVRAQQGINPFQFSSWWLL